MKIILILLILFKKLLYKHRENLGIHHLNVFVLIQKMFIVLSNILQNTFQNTIIYISNKQCTKNCVFVLNKLCRFIGIYTPVKASYYIQFKLTVLQFQLKTLLLEKCLIGLWKIRLGFLSGFSAEHKLFIGVCLQLSNIL